MGERITRRIKRREGNEDRHQGSEQEEGNQKHLFFAV